MTTIRPIHHSVRTAVVRKGARMKPNAMDSIRVPRELSDAMTRIALDIFTDCVNVGLPFQDALQAIYLSGLQNGAAIEKETA